MGSKPLVPKLRFPEFRDAPGWPEEPFTHLYRFAPSNTFSRDQLNYTSGTVKNIHYGDIHTRFQALFDIRRETVPYINSADLTSEPGLGTLCEHGNMIFADASEDVADVGKSIEVVELDGQRLVSGTHTILAKQRGSRLIVGFGGHLFRSPRIRARIRRESQGAKVLGLSPGRLATIPVSFPSDQAEQNRIAECLTSLDELIATEGRKLEALRTHKKGLLQYLFPREGETTPRLRFPEFSDAEGWEELQLQQIARPVSDRAVTGDGDNVLSLSGEHGLVLQSDYFGKKVAGDSADRYLKLLRNDFVYNDRTTKASPFGTIKRLSKYSGGIVSPIYKCFRFHAAEHAVFWEWYFESGSHDAQLSSLANEGARAGRFNISISQFLSTRAWRPAEPEQRKIAECLTSLDRLIEAEGRRLEALRVHQHGLMQVLFPSPESL